MGQSQGSGSSTLRAEQPQAVARFAQRSRRAGGAGIGALQRQYECRSASLEGGVSARPSGRAANELRELKFERGYTQHAEGSVLVSFGLTRVLCTASIEETVPGFL